MPLHSRLTNAELAAKFAALDTDGSGALDLMELHHASFSALRLPTTAADVAALLRRADANGDGRLDLAEWIAYARAREDELDEAFSEIDVDNDGFITGAELAGALQKVRFTSATEPRHVARALKLLDRDHDGRIDFDEFVSCLLLLPETQTMSDLFEHLRPSFDIGDNVTQPPVHHERHGTSVAHTLLAGGLAGAVSRTVTAPMDRLKTLLQAGSSISRGGGVVAGMRDIFAEGGWRGFFRGNGTNVLKIIPESGAKFYAFEAINRALAADGRSSGLPERFAAGAIAGAFAQAAVYPLEVAKTRLSLAPRGAYQGLIHCVQSIIAQEGMPKLYRGLGASMAGILPYAGVDMAVYSLLKERYLRERGAAGTRGDGAAGFSIPSPLVPLVCGAVSSTTGQIVSYPLQLVRTRLQSQGMAGRPVLYTGMVDCLRKTVQAEGWAGLYRGIQVNILKAAPAVAISYAVFEQSKELLESHGF
jgi:solute carrier family 25 phosphate transporter 23/24/25/41